MFTEFRTGIAETVGSAPQQAPMRPTLWLLSNVHLLFLIERIFYSIGMCIVSTCDRSIDSEQHSLLSILLLVV